LPASNRPAAKAADKETTVRTILMAVMIMMAFDPAAARAADQPEPPRAAQRPVRLEAHGDVRVDEYHWLREREDPAVLAYLEAENSYRDAVMAPTEDLQQELFAEITGRLVQDDASVPVFSRGWWYYTRYVEGGEYALHCRREGTLEAPEQVMLDGNRLGAGEAFFSLRGVAVSSDSRVVSYAVDTVGRRIYERRFRDLATGEDLPDVIAGVTPNGVWAEDGRTFYYARQDPQTLRSFQIWKHTLGTDPAADELVYEETDATFSCHVSKTKSRDYLIIHSGQTMSDEVRFLPADRPGVAWRVLQPRERGLEYRADHDGERWVIRTNLDAVDFQLVTCGEEHTGKEHWRPLVPPREGVLLEDFEVFAEHLVVAERRGGLTHLRVLPRTGGEGREIAFADPTYAAWIIGTPELDSSAVRYGYSSLTTPRSVYDHDLRSGEQERRKRDRVLGDFDPGRYASRYLHATAADGTEVPISLVWRRDRFQRGESPCLLYGYGSYGATMDAAFRSARLSLLDRGFVFAIAHVRGGEEMGRRWYEEGKLLQKRNTFTDFIACGEYLVAEGWSAPDRLYAMGGSAGGLLMGAVMNLAPQLWDGVVAQVPFVDVVTTMLDESIPLTTSEYDEWGNPHEKIYYDYMLSYSPYDQVTAQDYPHTLVTTGLHDSQVQYWEPAKWVARLRDRKTDDNLLVLSVNLDAGHGGASGRFQRYRETALEYAFLLMLAGRD
jgi:oligopeptidase B